jgi:MFS superfamily sulfate permease-like transporter
LRQLTPLALLITLVIMMQTATVTYSFQNSPDRPDVDRDFLGVGAGNIVAAFLEAFPVDASPPRTAVVVEAGSRSQLGALVAAVIVLALGLWGGALLIMCRKLHLLAFSCSWPYGSFASARS